MTLLDKKFKFIALFVFFHAIITVQLIIIRSLQSCPAINVYSAMNLERGLKAASENFCSQEVHVDWSAKQVRCVIVALCV